MVETREEHTSRFVFCRMTTPHRFVGLAMCAICRDQSYDFLWASAVQAAVALAGVLGGVYFVAEEVLLFTVLVLVKHRLQPPWERLRGWAAASQVPAREGR